MSNSSLRFCILIFEFEFDFIYDFGLIFITWWLSAMRGWSCQTFEKEKSGVGAILLGLIQEISILNKTSPTYHMSHLETSLFPRVTLTDILSLIFPPILSSGFVPQKLKLILTMRDCSMIIRFVPLFPY